MDREERWKLEGACRDVPDPNIFYPERGATVHPAKQVCSGCQVRLECLAFAVSIGGTEDWGVWGGTTKSQRDLIRSGARQEVRVA